MVLNFMPASTRIPEHPDPDTYRAGTIVLSLAPADFTWVGTDGLARKVRTGPADFLYLPPRCVHAAANLDQERISIVIAQDVGLGRRQTVLGQHLRDAVAAARRRHRRAKIVKRVASARSFDPFDVGGGA